MVTVLEFFSIVIVISVPAFVNAGNVTTPAREATRFP
jgi:hypothetical protein